MIRSDIRVFSVIAQNKEGRHIRRTAAEKLPKQILSYTGKKKKKDVEDYVKDGFTTENKTGDILERRERIQKFTLFSNDRQSSDGAGLLIQISMMF